MQAVCSYQARNDFENSYSSPVTLVFVISLLTEWCMAKGTTYLGTNRNNQQQYNSQYITHIAMKAGGEVI